MVTIYLGLDLVDLGTKGLYAVISFYIGEFLVFMFELYLILSKRSREKKSGPINNGGENWLPYPSFSVRG